MLLVFSIICIVVSRLLLVYSTIDKTSRLKIKSFSTVRDVQRGSQSFMEKRRGRRETEVTRLRLLSLVSLKTRTLSHYILNYKR